MLSKIEIVQNYFLEISHSLDRTVLKKKEAIVAHAAF
jgi:hypothetical protein